MVTKIEDLLDKVVQPISLSQDEKIERLSNETYLERTIFEEWIKILEFKKQMILFSPAGTGKTFVAEKFAEYLISIKGGEYRKVQFHPSYSYEDFVEGIKPRLEKGNITYEVIPGIFKDICDIAKENPTKKYVLIIDEINRGQTSRIFGELVNTLEYRDKPISLPYSKTDFTIPGNLFVIGTMNSTDRSVAFMDYAIRRRFAFYRLEPNDSVLTRYFRRHKPEMDANYIMKLFNDLNFIIQENLDQEFKIGHSYYMLEGLTTQKLSLIWNYTIRPLLNEYFFDDESKVNICQDLFDKINKDMQSENHTTSELKEKTQEDSIDEMITYPTEDTNA